MLNILEELLRNIDLFHDCKFSLCIDNRGAGYLEDTAGDLFFTFSSVEELLDRYLPEALNNEVSGDSFYEGIR